MIGRSFEKPGVANDLEFNPTGTLVNVSIVMFILVAKSRGRDCCDIALCRINDIAVGYTIINFTLVPVIRVDACLEASVVSTKGNLDGTYYK